MYGPHTFAPSIFHSSNHNVHAAVDPKKSVIHSTAYQLEMKVDDWDETVYSKYDASIDDDYTLLTLKRASPSPPSKESQRPRDILRLTLCMYAASSLKPIWSNVGQSYMAICFIYVRAPRKSLSEQSRSDRTKRAVRVQKATDSICTGTYRRGTLV